MTTLVISLVVIFVCGVMVGSRMRREKKARSKKEERYEHFDDKTFFISPIDHREAFKESDTIEQFISKIH